MIFIVVYWFSIDFHWFFIDFYWFSLKFIDVHWFLLIFHWNSLIFIVFHWFSLFFIDFSLKILSKGLHPKYDREPLRALIGGFRVLLILLVYQWSLRFIGFVHPLVEVVAKATRNSNYSGIPIALQEPAHFLQVLRVLATQ